MHKVLFRLLEDQLRLSFLIKTSNVSNDKMVLGLQRSSCLVSLRLLNGVVLNPINPIAYVEEKRDLGRSTLFDEKCNRRSGDCTLICNMGFVDWIDFKRVFIINRNTL